MGFGGVDKFGRADRTWLDQMQLHQVTIYRISCNSIGCTSISLNNEQIQIRSKPTTVHISIFHTNETEPWRNGFEGRRRDCTRCENSTMKVLLHCTELLDTMVLHMPSGNSNSGLVPDYNRHQRAFSPSQSILHHPADQPLQSNP
jgi:hypothetical protein